MRDYDQRKKHFPLPSTHNSDRWWERLSSWRTPSWAFSDAECQGIACSGHCGWGGISTGLGLLARDLPGTRPARDVGCICSSQERYFQPGSSADCSGLSVQLLLLPLHLKEPTKSPPCSLQGFWGVSVWSWAGGPVVERGSEESKGWH